MGMVITFIDEVKQQKTKHKKKKQEEVRVDIYK